MNSHPDTETLSAFLDGDAPDLQEHVNACPECRRRLDALGRVRTAIRAPVAPPDQQRRDAAVAAAVAAAAAARRPSPPTRRWRAAAAIGAVAAAIVVGVVVTRASTSHKSSTTAASGPTSGGLVRAGDLGEVDDAQALRERIQPALPAVAGAEGSAAGPFTGGAGGAATAAPTAKAESRSAASAVGGRAETPRCEAQARKLQPQGAVLTYVATARWQGTPADVFGFSPPGAPATSSPGRPAPTRVYVLARSDCRLLVFQSYAP